VAAGRRTISLLLMALWIAILAGCGSNSTSSNTSQSSSVSVAFQATPPKSITVAGEATLSAVVTNDPFNYGVDWSVSCANVGDCGSLSTTHSSSGAAVNYFPPATLPANSESVNIVAFAAADHTKNVLTEISVTGFASLLSGPFVFHARGTNIDELTGVMGPYQIAGVINLDGNGGVHLASVNGKTIGGEQTYSDSSIFSTTSVTGGSYFIGADGRGTLTINTGDASIGLGGTESFSIVFISGSEALITQSDGTASATGTLDHQSSTSAPTGGYAFVVTGNDSTAVPVAFGGVMNIDQTNGGISGSGSVADEDYNGAVQNCPAPAPGGQPGISGSVSSPDALGLVVFNLSACFTANPIQFTGYVVDATHIQMVETDIGAGVGFATGGTAIGQGSGTGKFSNFSGSFVLGILGSDVTGFANSLTAAATLVADAHGNVTGTADEFLVSGYAISDGFTGTYSVDPAGTGRVDIPIAFSNPSNPSPEYIFYQTGSGNSPLALDIDTSLVAEGVGTAYSQGSKTQLNGEYGVELTQMANYGIETDLTGQMTTSQSAGTVAGYLDGPGIFAAQLTGAFVTTPAIRFGGTLLDPDASGTSLQGTASVEYYLIDQNHGFFVENDLIQVSLGYFATRTPVCPTCP